MAKTYAVGASNSAVRLDDHIGPWIQLSPIGGVNSTWNDVMSDPIDETKVIIIGISPADGDGTVRGSIQVSNDAGINWVTPNGTWADNETIWYELWYVSSDVIWVTGSQGRVARSIDGGLTFNLVSAQISAGAYWNTAAIFAIDKNIAVVLGNPWPTTNSSELYVWKTINGGNNWALLGGQSLPAPIGGQVSTIGSAKGIWMSLDQNVIIVGSSYNHWKSTDGGTTWVDKLDDIVRSGEHLTWFPSYTSTTPEFIRHVGGILKIVLESTDFGESYNEIRGVGVGDPTQVIKGAHFYKPFTGYYTYTDAGVSHIDHTVNGGQTGVVSYTEPSSNKTFLSIWNSVNLTPCYELKDCSDSENVIYTNTDVSKYSGTVVTIKDENGKEEGTCWFVSDTLYNCLDVIELEIYNCFTDCVDCLPNPLPPIKPIPRIVDPGYDIGSCNLSKVVEAMCSFSEMKYQEMMSRRFTIKNCCPPNEMDVELSFEETLMNLNKSPNPTPDTCEPKCLSYQFVTRPGDSSTLTYIDCDENEAEVLTTANTVEELNLFCALDTTPPTVIVTHVDSTIDTYILEPIGDNCIADSVDTRLCRSYEVTMTNLQGVDVSFFYIDCDNIIQEVVMVGGLKSPAVFVFCGLEQTIIAPSNHLPSDSFIVIDQSECSAGLGNCTEYEVIVNTSVATSIRFINCNGQDDAIVVQADVIDQTFTFCGIEGQVLTTVGNVHNYINVAETGNCSN